MPATDPSCSFLLYYIILYICAYAATVAGLAAGFQYVHLASRHFHIPDVLPSPPSRFSRTNAINPSIHEGEAHL